jgi:putative ABC transport system ATP-binding protein
VSDIVTTKDIKKAYPMPGGELFWALKGISDEIPSGRLRYSRAVRARARLTLMNIMSALDQQTEGEVLFDGANLSKLSEAEKKRV